VGKLFVHAQLAKFWTSPLLLHVCMLLNPGEVNARCSVHMSTQGIWSRHRRLQQKEIESIQRKDAMPGLQTANEARRKAANETTNQAIQTPTHKSTRDKCGIKQRGEQTCHNKEKRCAVRESRTNEERYIKTQIDTQYKTEKQTGSVQETSPTSSLHVLGLHEAHTARFRYAQAQNKQDDRNKPWWFAAG
jgi:hypothetical protein